MTSSEMQWLNRMLRLVNHVSEPSTLAQEAPAEHAPPATQRLIRILNEIEADVSQMRPTFG